MKQPVRIRFSRTGQDPLPAFTVMVEDPLAVLNIANAHFGDPSRHIGGPALPRFEDTRPERQQ
jgi:hypothetical protein